MYSDRAGAGRGSLCFMNSHRTTSDGKEHQWLRTVSIPVVGKRRAKHKALRPWVCGSPVVHEPFSRTTRQRLDSVLPSEVVQLQGPG